MYISYLDSSGTPSLTTMENYVLAAVTVNERAWYSIKKKIECIKIKHFPTLQLDQIEFHVKDMMNRDDIYENLSWEKIYSILDDLFEIIKDDDTELTIIAVLIQKSELKKEIDVEEWGHRFLFERLNSYLEEQNKNQTSSKYPEYGIMIIDSEGKKNDNKLRNKLSNMLTRGTMYSKLNYLIEDPLFTDSKWRNLSQIADCVAYCIRKRYRQNTPSTHTTNWNHYYDMMQTKFHRKNRDYMQYGLKIFP